MHANQSYQKRSVPQYVKSLLLCSAKKVCTNLANAMNKSHDSIQKEITYASTKQDGATLPLETIAHNELNHDETYLIHDDTQLTKIYAKKIEGLDVGFDGSLGRAALGLKVITSLLTDRSVSIPIEAVPYIGKDLAQAFYKTKSDIAIGITKHVIRCFKIKRLLADAHFSTNIMLEFLHNEQINFLMKISRIRVVTIDGVTGQLQNILRLKKNNRMKSAKGCINGIACYFYAVKIYTGATIYFISNDQIDPHEAVALYKIRWNIEIFHRTAKQYLGLGDCQMRSIEKQRQHALYVMHAYAIVSVRRKLIGLPCVEDVIKHLRDAKSKCKSSQKTSSDRNFDYVA